MPMLHHGVGGQRSRHPLYLAPLQPRLDWMLPPGHPRATGVQVEGGAVCQKGKASRVMGIEEAGVWQ
jgi:hypothetical protein